MRRQVLLVRESRSDPEFDSVWHFPSDRYSCTSLQWNDLRDDALVRPKIDVIVAFVLTLPPAAATDLFRRVSSLPHQPVRFAVLSQQIATGALQEISGFVDDFVLWPASREEVTERIRRLMDLCGSEADPAALRLLREFGFNQLVGEDPTFIRALQQLPLLAQSDLPVLVTGETGTGKEFSARAIHHLGKRRTQPFVPVDCGAIPDHVFENEMFGHVRGGYTDAHANQEGLAAMADGGTLFLDEVDSLSAATQSKLLRFLQDRTFKPLGASKFVVVDVRIVAASNQDLDLCVRQGRFRADLFYRLNVLRLRLPPLRERPLDIPLLCRHFLRSIGPTRDGVQRSFTPAALRKMAAYPWPGNVRELQNIVQQAAVTSNAPQLRPEHISLPVNLGSSHDELPRSAAGFRTARAEALEAFERAYVERLLEESGGNVTQAAKQANRNRRSLGRLIKKYDIDRTAF